MPNQTSVRVATKTYGISLFGRIRIHALSDGGPRREKNDGAGGKTHRAFMQDDKLEWFDT
jgi:hypothetical protein